MSTHAPEKQATIVPFAPICKGQPDASIVADDSGRTIVALLQKAAEMAKDDCARAMDLAHKLAFQVREAEERAGGAEERATGAEERARGAEERAKGLEAEATHFRDRAARAEEWLLHIHKEVEHTFFQKEERDPRYARRDTTVKRTNR